MFFYNLCIIFCKDDLRVKIFVGNFDWEIKEGIYIFESYLGEKIVTVIIIIIIISKVSK